MTKKKKCEHFDYCGAYIMRDLIRAQKKFIGEEFREKEWKIEFCLSGNFRTCIHFEDGPAKKKIFERFQKLPAS